MLFVSLEREERQSELNCSCSKLLGCKYVNPHYDAVKNLKARRPVEDHFNFVCSRGGRGTPIYWLTGMCRWRVYSFQAIWSGKGYGFQAIWSCIGLVIIENWCSIGSRLTGSLTKD